jgi:hypothetical protein
MARLINAEIAWVMISLILLRLTYRLGSNNCASLGVSICTIKATILTIFGLFIPLSALTLSFTQLLSIPWLAVHHSNS